MAEFERKTLVVDESGRGDYRTLTEAVAACAETPELPPSSTPDSEPYPVWLAKKKEQQLAANLWNVYSHPTDLALSIALMQRSQLDMTNAQ